MLVVGAVLRLGFMPGTTICPQTASTDASLRGGSCCFHAVDSLHDSGRSRWPHPQTRPTTTPYAARPSTKTRPYRRMYSQSE